MPQVRFDGLVGQSYTLRNISYDCQRTINWYPELNETTYGKNQEPLQLVPTPGLKQILGGDDLQEEGISRGGYVASTGELYWMFGTGLYKINYDSILDVWSATLFPFSFPFTLDNSEVHFTDNGIDLFILSDNNIYTQKFNTGVITFQQAGAYNQVEVSSLTFLDGYVVFSQKNSNRFFWTDLYTTESPELNFASAESNPDEVVGLINNNLDLWIFGKTTIELWYNLGQGNVVFTRRPNTLIETGCAGSKTIQKIDNTIMWLASDSRGGATMVVAEGYVPRRISTFALEQQWAKFTPDQLSKSTGYVYQEGGHHFYVFNIPGADTTWVYDMTVSNQTSSDTWHERRAFYNDEFDRHQSAGHAYYSGFHITGDYNALEGTLYILDNNTFTDNGNPIVRERITPHLANNMNRLFYHSATFDFYTGVSEDVLLDPQVMLSYSDDGGHNWSNEMWVSGGKIGEYGLKVSFYRLGNGRNRVFRIRCTDPIYWALSGGALNITTGEH